MFKYDDEKREKQFWGKVYKTEKCWIWTGYKNDYGYGVFCWHGKRRMAHNVACMFAGKIIPAGLCSDHLCRNRMCVNPNHIEAVTLVENVMRGECFAAKKARQTECVRGHVLSGDNLHIRPDGHRLCRKCGADRARSYRNRKKERM